MMKARRSASNCGASAQVPERQNGREAVASQLSGLPHARARAPAGGKGASTHLQDGAHGVGCGPTQQGAELVEGLQVGLCRAWGSISLGRETRAGSARLPPHSSFLPSPAPFMVNPNIIPVDWPGQPPCQSPQSSHRFSLCISQAAVACCCLPHPAATEQFLIHCLPRGAVPLTPSSHRGSGSDRGPVLPVLLCLSFLQISPQPQKITC